MSYMEQNSLGNGFYCQVCCGYHPSQSCAYQQQAGMFQQGWANRNITFEYTSFHSQESQTMDGTKPIVVCNGQTQQSDDMNAAQALAESLAHKHSADAYILKPVKKVSPKRDVVTTDL